MIEHDTVVIGGGQSGLAMSCHLSRLGRDHVILDRDPVRTGVSVIASGAPRQERGITSCPGLYFLGLNWMHTVTSGLLCGVGADAEYVSRHIAIR
jgi:putative flavoprotein involved in K+ transport